MRDVSGITGAAPIWVDVMAWLHHRVPSTPPPPPGGVVARAVSFPDGIEADRTEWFLKGTEPVAPERALGGGPPRILVPAAGTIIALDPDIPPLRQRIIFESHGGGGGLRWVLDGRDIGPAAELLAWEPLPGRHTLSLVDEEQRPVDTAAFEVRGTALGSRN
jgi:penicillin-binding protein 1C